MAITAYIDNPAPDYREYAHYHNSNDINLGSTYDNHEQIYGVVTSIHFEGLLTEKDIAKRLFSLQILLTGAKLIEEKGGLRKRIEFNRFKIENHPTLPNGSYSVYSDSLEKYPFAGTEKDNAANPIFHHPTNLGSALFSVAKIDNIVRSMLYYAGMIRIDHSFDKVLTWTTLYKMLDTIIAGCANIGIGIDQFITKANLGRFTSACNNTMILGIEARHGIAKGNRSMPAATPITDIKEATGMILCVSHKFLVEYVNQKRYFNFSIDIEKCLPPYSVDDELVNDLAMFNNI